MNNLKEWIAVLEAGSPLTSQEMKVIIKSSMNPTIKSKLIRQHYKNLYKDHEVRTTPNTAQSVIPYSQD